MGWRGGEQGGASRNKKISIGGGWGGVNAAVYHPSFGCVFCFQQLTNTSTMLPLSSLNMSQPWRAFRTAAATHAHAPHAAATISTRLAAHGAQPPAPTASTKNLGIPAAGKQSQWLQRARTNAPFEFPGNPSSGIE